MQSTSSLDKAAQSGQRSSKRAHAAAEINMGDPDRWAAVLGGGALACYGLARGKPVGLALAALGGLAVYRGITGHCPLYGVLGINTAGHRPAATSIPAGH